MVEQTARVVEWLAGSAKGGGTSERLWQNDGKGEQRERRENKREREEKEEDHRLRFLKAQLLNAAIKGHHASFSYFPIDRLFKPVESLNGGSAMSEGHASACGWV